METPLQTWSDHYVALMKYKMEHGTINISPREISESKNYQDLAMWVTYQQGNLHRHTDEQRQLWNALVNGDQWSQWNTTLVPILPRSIVKERELPHITSVQEREPPPRELKSMMVEARELAGTQQQQEQEQHQGTPILDTQEEIDKRPRPASYRGSRHPPNTKDKSRKAGHSNHNRQWDDMFSRLKKYNETYGDCNVPVRFADDPPFGKWVSRQREMHAKGFLGANRIARLETLGFQWRVGKHNPKLGGQAKYEEIWIQRFEQLINYKEEHGDCRVPLDYEDRQFRGWVHKQRGAELRKTMRPDRRKLLARIGFFDDIMDYPMKNPYAAAAASGKKFPETSSVSPESAKAELAAAAKTDAEIPGPCSDSAETESEASDVAVPLGKSSLGGVGSIPKTIEIELTQCTSESEEGVAIKDAVEGPSNENLKPPAWLAIDCKSAAKKRLGKQDASPEPTYDHQDSLQDSKFAAKRRLELQDTTPLPKEQPIQDHQYSLQDQVYQPRSTQCNPDSPQNLPLQSPQNQFDRVLLRNELRQQQQQQHQFAQASIQNRLLQQQLEYNEALLRNQFHQRRLIASQNLGMQQLPFESTAAYLQRTIGLGRASVLPLQSHIPNSFLQQASFEEQLQLQAAAAQLQALSMNQIRQLQLQCQTLQDQSLQDNNQLPQRNTDLNLQASVVPPANATTNPKTADAPKCERSLTTVTPPLSEDEEPVSKKPKVLVEPTGDRTVDRAPVPIPIQASAPAIGAAHSYVERDKPSTISATHLKPIAREIRFPSVDDELKAVHHQLSLLAAEAVKNGTLKPRSKRKICRFRLGSALAVPTLGDINGSRWAGNHLPSSEKTTSPRKRAPVSEAVRTPAPAPVPQTARRVLPCSGGTPTKNVPALVTPDRPLPPLSPHGKAEYLTGRLNLLVTDPSKVDCQEIRSFEDVFVAIMNTTPAEIISDWKRKPGWSYVSRYY